MSYSVLLEKLLKDIGGCGQFQWILAVIVSVCSFAECWSMLHMSFLGQEPSYFCVNATGRNATLATEKSENSGKCSLTNSTACSRFQFDDEMRTIVSEWSLVCDREWTVATITTLQMIGVLVGCFIAGQLADWIGRKWVYFLSLVSFPVLNIIAYFSVSWEMYAVLRLLLGVMLGFDISSKLNLVCEFLTTSWRPVFIAFPIWCIAAGGFALLAWLCQDWKTVHLATALAGIPSLLIWWLVPESFRWLITKGRYKDAESVINKIADKNRRQVPDLTEIVEQAKLEESVDAQHQYTVLDMFKTRENIVKSTGLLFIWASMSYGYYGLTFGIQNMAGNLYLNMFLVNIVEVPVNFVTIYAVNKLGRKKWCIVSFFFTGMCGIGNGILQQIEFADSSVQNTLVNMFALGSRLGLAAGWTAMAVMTVEIYPTVIRATAYGLANTSARIGGAIAPQIVFLNNHIPGILFFLSAAVMIVSSLLCFLFPETKDMDLEDTMHASSASSRMYLKHSSKESDNKKWTFHTPPVLTTSVEKVEDKEITVTKF